MRLFEVVPANFFSILSSANREIYFDALMILHEMFRFELNIRVDDFIASLISILEDRSFEIEDEDDLQDGGLTLSGKSRYILNRLVKTGWIEKEFLEGSFIEIITPRTYAIPFMKLMCNLNNDALQEYNSLVFATYSGLKQAITEDKSHMYEALISAKLNTEQLQYSLRTLYHGIRTYLREIVDKKDINVLLKSHFEEYKKMSDQIYHPIKTMDSVHRYMAPIQNLLVNILSDETNINSMRARALSIKKYDNEIEVEHKIINDIDYIMDSYQSIGDLVSEIDRKHSKYTKSSIEKIQYLMTADQTIKGKLAELLKTYASLSDDKRDLLVDIMESNIHANRQEFFDSGSLYHKNVRSRRIDRAPLAIEDGNEFPELAGNSIWDQIKNGYPIARVRAFVEGMFCKGIDQVEAKDIQITSDSEFILLILAAIRQNENGMPYTIEMGTGRTIRNGYSIPNMTIHKKGSALNVE